MGREVVAASTASRLAELQANPLAKNVRKALSSYLTAAGLRDAMPGDEWTVRPLPSTGARRDLHRLFTVNVSNMETLYGFFNPQSGEDQGGCLHVWHELAESLPRLSDEFDIVELEDVFYKTADGRARAISYMDLGELARLLADAEIAAASARLVAYLRSSGQVPGMQRRWHDPSFASWLE
jgi:hypothetical protein